MRAAWHKFKAKGSNGFGSKLECAVHDILKLREKNGEIENIKAQQTVVLQDGDRSVKITWRVDFSFVDSKTKKTWYVEAKGFETADYRLKLKMFKAKQLGNLEIWKGNYKRPVLAERFEI